MNRRIPHPRRAHRARRGGLRPLPLDRPDRCGRRQGRPSRPTTRTACSTRWPIGTTSSSTASCRRPPAAIAAAKSGKPLPHGTVLTLVQYKAVVDAQGNPVKDAKGRFQKGDLVAYTVMEKRAGWGTEYADDIRNGEWEYAAFGADGKFNDKANYKACFQCHKPHDAMDFVISHPAMAGRMEVMTLAAAPPGSIPVQHRRASPSAPPA